MKRILLLLCNNYTTDVTSGKVQLRVITYMTQKWIKTIIKHES